MKTATLLFRIIDQTREKNRQASPFNIQEREQISFCENAEDK